MARRKKPAKSVVTTEDIVAGRMLLRMTCGEMAQLAQVHLESATHPQRVCAATRDSFMRILQDRGVEFARPGVVRHVDGRTAPTIKAVGKMTGKRLRRARGALGLTLLELASLSRLSVGSLQRLEAAGEPRQRMQLYAAVGALQLAGYRFGRCKTDKALVRRKDRRRDEDQDLPIEWLTGPRRMKDFEGLD